MPFDSPLILSLSPFDAAQGDAELVEGSKDERHAQDRLTNSWTTDARLARSQGEAEALQPATVMMDEQAFHAFYRRTAAPLRAYVVGVLGSVTPADDIVQEAYVRILRSPPATGDEQQLRAFLFRVASNLMTDHWRRQRHERGARDPRAPEPAVAAINMPLRVDMARTFARLPAQQRQLLWLAYVEGADHREIARALGLRHLSVRVLLYRAKRRLAHLLDPLHHGQGEQ